MVLLPRLALRGWRKGCEEESELKIGQGGRGAGRSGSEREGRWQKEKSSSP